MLRRALQRCAIQATIAIFVWLATSSALATDWYFGVRSAARCYPSSRENTVFFTALGLANADYISRSVDCPISYLREIVWDGYWRSFYPTTSSTSVVVRVLDATSSGHVSCTICGSNAYVDSEMFDSLCISPPVETTDVFVGSTSLTLDVNSLGPNHELYVWIHCTLPATPQNTTYHSSILGYYFAAVR